METVPKPTFPEFKAYCLKIEQSLSQLPGYSPQYKVPSPRRQVSNHPFAKDHDGEYLLVTVAREPYLITINFTYSIAYQVPLFYFMIYNE